MPKINVVEAVTAANGYLQDVKDMMKIQFESLRLEEVELSEDQREWLITLGFDIPIKSNAMNSLTSMMSGTNSVYQREYKLFKVDSETGEVKSMKIRSLK